MRFERQNTFYIRATVPLSALQSFIYPCDVHPRSRTCPLLSSYCGTMTNICIRDTGGPHHSKSRRKALLFPWNTFMKALHSLIIISLRWALSPGTFNWHISWHWPLTLNPSWSSSSCNSEHKHLAMCCWGIETGLCSCQPTTAALLAPVASVSVRENESVHAHTRCWCRLLCLITELF